MLDIPKEWGWYAPGERLGQNLRVLLEKAISSPNILLGEIVVYHQDRDHVLLRDTENTDRYWVVSLHRQTLGIDFDGSFSEFSAREQRRHEIEKRMANQTKTQGVCPVCFATISDVPPCGGIWAGSTKSAAANGPLHHTQCKNCLTFLNAFPTQQQADAGQFFWEFYRWGPN